MTRWQLLTLFGIIGIILAGVYFWPVRAQDIPPCVDADAFVASMLASDPKAREHLPYELETHRTDKTRFVEAKGIVWLLLTNHGCLMVEPMFLDYAKDRGEPA